MRSNDNFEESFKKILGAVTAKEEGRVRGADGRFGRKKKPRKLDLGSTRSGQALAVGQFSDGRERRGPDHRGNWKIRTYRQNPGASKGRGKTGGIRQ